MHKTVRIYDADYQKYIYILITLQLYESYIKIFCYMALTRHSAGKIWLSIRMQNNVQPT